MGCGCHDPELRQEKDQITGLPLDGDGDEYLAVDSPSGCATVYAAVPRAPIGDVRVNLYAALFGVRELVASAMLAPGFKGACIEATGIQVDGWHVTFNSTNPAQVIRAGIQAGRGCSAFAVNVPQRLQIPPSIDTPPALYARNVAPQGRLDGLPSVYTEAGGATVALRSGERVLAIAAKANALLPMTITLILPMDVNQLITVDPGDSYRLEPGGSIGGPGTIDFVNADRFTVYTVR